MTVREQVRKDPDVRFQEVRETRDADFFEVMDLEKPAQKVALRFQAVTKSSGCLSIIYSLIDGCRLIFVRRRPPRIADRRENVSPSTDVL